MNKNFKRFISALLVIVTVITALPFASKDVMAAERKSKLNNLGNLGTVKIGNKSESGTWWQTQIEDNPVFCLDLGKACHTGWTYVSSEKTISSDSNNKSDALKAKIGYWYSVTKKGNTKAWVYAQCLIWAVEEGVTSEDGLKNIIKQVKDNTGYYKDDKVYGDIFDIAGVVTCEVFIWKYKSDTDEDEIQKLMQIKGDKVEYKFFPYNNDEAYRQRITLRKNDEDGNPLSKVNFRFTAKNNKELYSYKFNGWGDAESGDADDDATKFTQDVLTDSNGKITFRFTYKLQSKNYYYVPEDVLSQMSSDAKKEMKDILDDEGFKYAADLSKDGAKKLAQKDLDDQFKDIENTYIIEELDSGNDNILKNFTVEQGSNKVSSNGDSKITIKLSAADSWTKVDGEWPETADETYSEFRLAYKPVLKDKYKKVKINAVKVDAETGRVTQGDATFKDAVYGVYSDSKCTKLLDTYKTNEKGEFSTKDYRCGTDLYMKEITPPTGYLKNNEIYTIDTDGKQFSAEYNSISKRVDEDVIKGDVSIIKGMTNGAAGFIKPEKNAEFQVYLASAGSYEKAKDTERDSLVTDEEGYAKTKKLPYGTYIVHQTKGMDETEFCPDFYVDVKENGKTYKYYLNNPIFHAYLKIVKKDSQTKKTVLKAGTTYQIYKLSDDGTETLVKQSYSNGNQIVNVDRFVSDESGEIITYEKLEAGDYRVYEVEGPNGFRNEKRFIDIKITNKSYKEVTDAEGNKYLYAEYEYFNNETYGKFKLEKTGPVISGFEATTDNPLVKEFTYENIFIPNAVFELVAKEDIATQDNQGETWFKEGDIVATITTGKGAEFTSDCEGICSYKLDDKGIVEVNVPLGKYEIKEVNTVKGRVLPKKAAWDLEFVWNSQLDEYVYDTSGNTEDGVLKVNNEFPKTEISIKKQDNKTEEAIPGTVFGFYSKDNIYDKDGNIIVKANEKMATVVTDENGKAVIPFSVPVADDEVTDEESSKVKTTTEEVTTEIDTESVTTESETVEEESKVYNTGNYYFLEESISDSYYLSKEPTQVHVSYKDQNTRVIEAEAVVKDTQTEVEIDKRMIASSQEISGCKLRITDSKNREIVSWISGDENSITVAEGLDELGYSNFKTEMTKEGNLIIRGLLHDEEYKLYETKPADGFVTANEIPFKLMEVATEGESSTQVFVKNGNEFKTAEENKVVMFDDTTKIQFSKTSITDGKELPGCQMKVTDKETGKVMDEWTSTKNSHMVEGKYVVGKTYILSETKPADGFVTATKVEFTVQDDGAVQKVHMVDDTTKVEFSKFASDTKKQLKGAKYEVYNSKGKKVYKFTTGKKAELIEGVLKVGETYTFKEVDAPENYKVAKDVSITIKDTGKIQKLSAVDARIPVVPDTPQTGREDEAARGFVYLGGMLILTAINFAIFMHDTRVGKKGKKKDEEDD
jgi:hypothetical protein